MESSIQLLNNWGQQVMCQPKVTFSGHMISVSYFLYLLENENYSYHVLKLRSTVKIKADYCDLSILYLFFCLF